MFPGDADNEHVVLARERLEEERARLEAQKTPTEKCRDLEQKIAQGRNAIGNKVLALAKAHQEAQEAQERVDQLDGELQAALQEVTDLEVQQDQYKAQMPPSHHQVPQEETPEERQCASIIDFLSTRLGSTAHNQQTINEMQDLYLRLASNRTRTQAVQDDSLEDGLPEEVPWPLLGGSPIRQTLVTQGSVGTQRHVATYIQNKGSAKGKGKGRRSDNGKGTNLHAQDAQSNHTEDNSSQLPASTPTPPAATTAAPTATAAPSSSTPPESTVPQDQPNEMADANGPERGAKRPASDANANAAQAVEEDEFQEAARYRRGDGHLC
jgi:hypothetical protein